MSKFKSTAAFVALFTCLTSNAIGPAFAAQMDFQESLEEEASSQPVPPAATLDSEFCEEPPQPQLNSEDEPQHKLSLGSNLIASAVVSDIPLGIEGKQTLIAQVPICDLGGIAPATGGLAAGGPNLLAPILGAVGAGGAICGIVCGGGGDDEEVPPVPEPSDFATAGLFTSLGLAGILYRRKLKQGQASN